MIIYALSAVVVLGVLIIVHESGHFWVAKKMGVLVEKFSIGFGRKIWSKKIGETEYIVSWVPLGGYVKMHGAEDDETIENMGSDGDSIPLDPEKSYANKPVWRRLLIISAGPFANLIFAAMLFSVVYMIGIPMPDTKIKTILPDSPAEQAGIFEGDRIIEINGTPIDNWGQISEMISGFAGVKTNLILERVDGVRIELSIIPETKSAKTIFGEEIKVGRIGIAPEEIFTRYGVFESLYMGAAKCIEIIYLTGLVIVKIFQNVVPADTIGGPLMILKIAGDQAQAGIVPLIMFMGVLSVNLGILNFLPIPILDGGHILFLVIEAAIGKPVSVRGREIAQQVGLFLLISLMVFAFYNDISRFIAG